MLRKFKTFLDMIRFEHSIFALPFAYLGLFLASQGFPRADIFWGVTLAMIGFRTTAMGLNRLIDHSIDALNPRTRERALPAGRLTRTYVWLWTLISFAIYEASAYRLGSLCFMLSPIPLLLAILYPFMKRFSWASHFVLGAVLGIAPYGAWLAARPEFSWVPGFMTIGVLSWVAGFDIIYALQDEDFDRREGYYSFPARFGKKASLQITTLLHIVTIVCWALAGWIDGLSWIYFAGLFFGMIFLIREHWLVRLFGLQKIEEAFFKMNAVISVSLFLFTLLATTASRSL